MFRNLSNRTTLPRSCDDPNPVSQAPAAKAAAYEVVLGLLAEERIRPVVARDFPLAEAAEARRFLGEDSPTGKAVLTA